MSLEPAVSLIHGSPDVLTYPQYENLVLDHHFLNETASTIDLLQNWVNRQPALDYVLTPSLNGAFKVGQNKDTLMDDACYICTNGSSCTTLGVLWHKALKWVFRDKKRRTRQHFQRWISQLLQSNLAFKCCQHVIIPD